jgi:hypothetical protein
MKSQRNVHVYALISQVEEETHLDRDAEGWRFMNCDALLTLSERMGKEKKKSEN